MIEKLERELQQLTDYKVSLEKELSKHTIWNDEMKSLEIQLDNTNDLILRIQSELREEHEKENECFKDEGKEWEIIVID